MKMRMLELDDKDQESGLANFYMTIIGVGYLFPISAIWAAFDYWKMLFPNRNIEFNVTLVYQGFSLLTVMFLSLSQSLSLGPRILGGFCGQFASLAAILAFRWLITLLPADALYSMVLLLVALCAVATGYLDSALLSLCSQYSPRMQSWLQLGIGFGTLVSVIYRDTTKLLFNNDMANSVTCYFSVALVTVLVCICCYKLLMRHPVSRCIAQNEGYIPLSEGPMSPMPMSPMLRGASLTPTSSPLSLTRNYPGRKGSLDSQDLEGPGQNRTPTGGPPGTPKHKARAAILEEPDEEDHASFGSVLAIVWKNQLTTFLNFVLTTLCYPGLLTSIPCRNFVSLRADAWFQTILLTVFTVSDMLGRFLLERRCGLTHKNIFITVIIRAFLFPALLACSQFSMVTDSASLFFVALFGAGNGYCVSLSLIVVNEIPNLSGAQRKTCGRISACAVNGGLAVGSFLSAALAAAIGLSSSE